MRAHGSLKLKEKEKRLLIAATLQRTQTAALRLADSKVDAMLACKRRKGAVAACKSKIRSLGVEVNRHSLASFDVNALKAEEALERNAVLARARWGDKSQDDIVRVYAACICDLYSY